MLVPQAGRPIAYGRMTRHRGRGVFAGAKEGKRSFLKKRTKKLLQFLVP
jgi:hypothetical protein